MKKITLFSDGSSLGNPGAGGYAAILRYGDKERIVSGGEQHTTNNRMELRAVIEALKVLKEPCEVDIYTDSQYVQKAIEQWLEGWVKKSFKNVKNVDLWKEYLDISKIHKVRAFWVKGHNNHPENERCDEIAKDEASKIKVVYE
ncbi:MAG: ribonuclease HI [Campylobacterales bacterium]